jgi:hypothetical protein
MEEGEEGERGERGSHRSHFLTEEEESIVGLITIRCSLFSQFWFS